MLGGLFFTRCHTNARITNVRILLFVHQYNDNTTSYGNLVFHYESRSRDVQNRPPKRNTIRECLLSTQIKWDTIRVAIFRIKSQEYNFNKYNFRKYSHIGIEYYNEYVRIMKY